MAGAALNLDLVRLAVERLEDRLDYEDATVEQILEFGGTLPQKLPMVLVGLVRDDYDQGAAPETGTHQRATATLGIWHVIKCRNTRRNQGGPAVDPMARFVGATRDVLQAWLPEGVHRSTTDPLRLRRGSLDRIEDSRAVWLDEYVFSWRPAGRNVQT